MRNQKAASQKFVAAYGKLGARRFTVLAPADVAGAARRDQDPSGVFGARRLRSARSTQRKNVFQSPKAGAQSGVTKGVAAVCCVESE